MALRDGVLHDRGRFRPDRHIVIVAWGAPGGGTVYLPADPKPCPGPGDGWEILQILFPRADGQFRPEAFISRGKFTTKKNIFLRGKF